MEESIYHTSEPFVFRSMTPGEAGVVYKGTYAFQEKLSGGAKTRQRLQIFGEKRFRCVFCIIPFVTTVFRY